MGTENVSPSLLWPKPEFDLRPYEQAWKSPKVKIAMLNGYLTIYVSKLIFLPTSIKFKVFVTKYSYPAVKYNMIKL